MITLAAVLEGIRTLLEPIVTNVVIKVLARHVADPSFGTKAQAWSTQFDAAQAGGSKDDLAKASADLQSLMAS